MTKQELEQKIEELQKQIEELKNVKIEEKQKKWKPAVGEKYYYINVSREIYYYNFVNDRFDNDCVNSGNCFKTKEEAEFALYKIKYTSMFKDFIEEHSDPLDWEDDDDKWCMVYDFCNDNIVFVSIIRYKTQGVIYASSKKILEDAIAYVGEDEVKKYVLGVGE